MSRHHPLIFDLLLTERVSGAWRRLRISSGATLARAQRVICIAFGWRPGGRGSFEVGHLRYESDANEEAVEQTRLRQVLMGTGAVMGFEYERDGFDVSVTVTVELTLPPGSDPDTPRCLGGAGVVRDLRDEGLTDQLRTLPVNVAAINAELLQLRR